MSMFRFKTAWKQDHKNMFEDIDVLLTQYYYARLYREARIIFIYEGCYKKTEKA